MRDKKHLEASLQQEYGVLTELLEGSLGPDTESADVTSGGELQKVKGVHLDAVNAGDVTESLSQTLQRIKS